MLTKKNELQLFDQKKRLIVFIRNKTNPSNYYRIFQFIDSLKENYSIKVVNSFPLFYHKYLGAFSSNLLLTTILKSITYFIVSWRLFFELCLIIFQNNESILFVQREIFPKRIGLFQKKLFTAILKKNRIIWDIDDNIIAMKEISTHEFELLSFYSSTIFVCNSFLLQYFKDEYQDKIVLLPTSDTSCSQIEITSVISKRLDSYYEVINLVWLGTFNNIIFLENILKSLEDTATILKLKHQKKLVLKVVSDTTLAYSNKYLIIKNIKWSRETAITELLTAHIGLMPLFDNEIAKGKCAFKAVQYLGYAIPVIASNVGFNKEVIENDFNGFLISDDSSWCDKIIELSTDKNKWIQFATNSRNKWLTRFSTDMILSKMKDLLD